MARTGIILLAAGASSRFGAPKQIALFKGQTLIRRAVDAALGSSLRPIVVVLGANHEEIAPQVAGHVLIRINSNWGSGMGSSIRCGLTAIEEDVDAVIIMLCDQPFITSEILNRFQSEPNQGLAAAQYGNSVGVPALFGREFFPALRRLNDNGGAKQVLLQHLERVARIPCPQAEVDIDTTGDYQRLTEFEPG